MRRNAEGSGMELDPQSQAVLDGLNASGVLPFRQFTPAQVRERVLAIRAAAPTVSAHEVGNVTEQMVVSGGRQFPVRIIRPKTEDSDMPSPVVIWFHGGGFLFGSLDEADETARAIASQAGVIVVNVGYHLAPEFPDGPFCFPTG